MGITGYNISLAVSVNKLTSDRTHIRRVKILVDLEAATLKGI